LFKGIDLRTRNFVATNGNWLHFVLRGNRGKLVLRPPISGHKRPFDFRVKVKRNKGNPVRNLWARGTISNSE